MNAKELEEIFNRYGFDKNLYIGCRAISVGHINTTGVLYFDYGNKVKRYLLQMINTNVFKNPQELMENIEGISNYSINVLKCFGVSNYENKMITIIKTKDGCSYVKTSFNNYYRVYNFIEGGVSFDSTEDKRIFNNAGKIIGFFQTLLANYPAHKLHDTIKNFHNTPARFVTFKDILNKSNKELKETCKDEINFYLDHSYIADYIQPLLDNGEMPLRVTHNDTKMNNIMFDYETKEGLCLMDLDTVMSGSVCYDFGDFVRTACNKGKEDDQNLKNVIFDKDLFIVFATGYIESVKAFITKSELDNLVNGAILMTYECGMRFLTDYLDGSKYFKIEYPDHNLVRTRTQMSMVKQMLSCKRELEEEILRIYKKQ